MRAQLDAEKLEPLRRRVGRLTHLEAMVRGELVPVAEVVTALATGFQQLGKMQRASVAASCRELGMPDAALRIFVRNLARA